MYLRPVLEVSQKMIFKGQPCSIKSVLHVFYFFREDVEDVKIQYITAFDIHSVAAVKKFTCGHELCNLGPLQNSRIKQKLIWKCSETYS